MCCVRGVKWSKYHDFACISLGDGYFPVQDFFFFNIRKENGVSTIDFNCLMFKNVNNL